MRWEEIMILFFVSPFCLGGCSSGSGGLVCLGW